MRLVDLDDDRHVWCGDNGEYERWSIDPEVPVIEKSHWIPCSERLPKKGQECIVCDNGVILLDTFLGLGNPYNWKWYTRDYEAWMPLPEPYGGEYK